MMLPYLFLCAAFVGPGPSDPPAVNEGLKWESDLETAQRQARASGRLLLIHFGGSWCPPCRRLEQQVFSQPGFGRGLAARYVAVKIDPHEHPELAKQFGVRAFPMDIVTTARGQLLMRTESPTSVAAYSETLNRIADSVQPSSDIAGTSPAATDIGSQQPASHDPLDRYAAYYNRHQSASAPPPSAEQPRSTEESRPAAPRQPSAPASVAESRPVDPRAPLQQTLLTSQNPPIALDGYCAVTLVQRRRWELGDKQWGAIHRGRTYLFVSEQAQQAFLADPDRYSPVFSGHDPVLRVENNKLVSGKREHGAFYNDRIYLFTSEDTFQQFNRDPGRYMVETSRQARRR